MNTIRIAAAATLCLAFLASAVMAFTHCATTSQAEKQQMAAASYATAQLDCVVQASTQAAADACRAAVWAKYCGAGQILDDAGACEKDGGR